MRGGSYPVRSLHSPDYSFFILLFSGRTLGIPFLGCQLPIAEQKHKISQVASGSWQSVPTCSPPLLSTRWWDHAPHAWAPELDLCCFDLELPFHLTGSPILLNKSFVGGTWHLPPIPSKLAVEKVFG